MVSGHADDSREDTVELEVLYASETTLASDVGGERVVVSDSETVVEAVAEPASRGRGRRGWLIAGACVLAVVLVVGTWVVASRFQSPAQREAAAAAPSAQPVTVEVTRGDLVQRTTAMAKGTAQGARDVVIPTGAGGTSVVTRVGAAAGTELASGQAAVWVNDRPVIAWKGAFPLYRDIGEGDSGEDVRMLQQALADLGYSVKPDGNFGSYTAQCVKSVYKKAGSVAPTREVPDEEATKKAAANAKNGEAAEAKTKKQVVVPVSEAMVVADLPAQVTKTPDVGTVLAADSAKISLSGKDVSLTASVPGSVATQLSAGTSGSAALGETSVAVRVDSVKSAAEVQAESAAQTSESDGGSSTSTDQGSGQASSDSVVTFAPVDGVFSSEWAGREDILVTIDLSAPLVDVLQVPQRAIATDAGGGASILVEQSDGSFADVVVSTQACVNGMCALKDATGVDAGSLVRVDR